jgi:prepilin-type N-terminal cleavage/methylation domain-containing protein/prepilin-type processing-associated H-X9-DG protein
MRKGFTLIELLVVIAIIAILAAILFPVFAKAREKARQSSCLSNVKQIVLATLQYIQDYDEVLPSYGGTPRVTVQTRVQPYMKSEQIWVCPSSSASFALYWDNNVGYPPTVLGPQGSYGWSNRVINGVKLAQLQTPAETGMWCDAQNTGTWTFTILWENNFYRTAAPHNEGGNMGFVDGHAKWLKKDELKVGTGSGATVATWDKL